MKYINILKVLGVSVLTLSLVACNTGIDTPALNDDSIQNSKTTNKDSKNSDEKVIVVDDFENKSSETIYHDIVGKYAGMIDNTSIIINIEDGPISLLIKENMDFSHLKNGDEVVFNYSEITEAVKNGEIKSNHLKSIEKIKSDSKNISTERTLEYKVEGENNTIHAFQEKSLKQNFELLVAQGFSFNELNDGSVEVSFKKDKRFNFQISRLENLTVDEYEKEIGKKYEGIMHVLESNQLHLKFFQDAELYIVAETGDISLPQGLENHLYLLKKFNGEPFKITLNFPLSESMEGINPLLWSMLKTIEPLK